MSTFAYIVVDSLLETEHCESLIPDNIYWLPLAIFLFKNDTLDKLKVLGLNVPNNTYRTKRPILLKLPLLYMLSFSLHPDRLKDDDAVQL